MNRLYRHRFSHPARQGQSGSRTGARTCRPTGFRSAANELVAHARRARANSFSKSPNAAISRSASLTDTAVFLSTLENDGQLNTETLDSFLIAPGGLRFMFKRDHLEGLIWSSTATLTPAGAGVKTCPLRVHLALRDPGHQGAVAVAGTTGRAGCGGSQECSENPLRADPLDRPQRVHFAARRGIDESRL